MIALEFPEINSILRWKDIFPGFNKIALIAVAVKPPNSDGSQIGKLALSSGIRLTLALIVWLWV